MLGNKTRIVLLIVALLVGVAAVALAAMQLPSLSQITQARQPTLDEQIAHVRAIDYDEIAPYLDARFVWGPHKDGTVRAWWCTENNYDKLPPRSDQAIMIWLANYTTEKYARRPARSLSDHFAVDERRVGDSPWGAFETITWLRELAVPFFEETKEEYIEILRKLDERERQAVSPAETPPS